MSGSEKKSEEEHMKRVTRKFLEVSRCSRAKVRKCLHKNTNCFQIQTLLRGVRILPKPYLANDFPKK